jgi:hypothetical protein
MAESHSIPSWIAGRLLSAKKVSKIRASIKQNLSNTIRAQLAHTEEQIQGSLRLLVEREVAALTAFQNL